MRKLKRFTLASSDRILDAGSMVGITGGLTARSTSCSTTCSSGTQLEITNCNGDCVSKNGEYVACIGTSQELWKKCR